VASSSTALRRPVQTPSRRRCASWLVVSLTTSREIASERIAACGDTAAAERLDATEHFPLVDLTIDTGMVTAEHTARMIASATPLPRPATTIEWPGRRADIAAALSVLADPNSAVPDRYPSLTDAVHWLIDDTGWDYRSPRTDIGEILVNDAEADAVAAVLEPLLGLLDEFGPLVDDAVLVQDPRWTGVLEAARHAIDRLDEPDAPGQP
jgi:hypothetical protein